MRCLFISIMLVLMLPSTSTASVQLNDDGRQLIAEAAEAYARDIHERPLVEDDRVTSYLQGVADRLLNSSGVCRHDGSGQ
jgi:competence protein ComGC